jgi:hypothetical protein
VTTPTIDEGLEGVPEATVPPSFVDRVDLANYERHLSFPSIAQNPSQWFWSTWPTLDDSKREVFEIRLREPRRVNNINLEVATFPHRVIFQWYDEANGEWVTAYSTRLYSSFPERLLSRVERIGQVFHPQHSFDGHWHQVVAKFAPVTASSFRVVLIRISDFAGANPPRDDQGKKVPYSLGLRNFDLGYTILSKDDLPRDVPQIDASIDALGSTRLFTLRTKEARGLLESPVREWVSEPQPVNSAVVNLYLDVRDVDGNGQVIERFFLDPTHSGSVFSIYWSNNDPGFAFEAEDAPLIYGPDLFTEGSVIPSESGINFSDEVPSHVDVDNTSLQFDPLSYSWWMGLKVDVVGDPQGVIPLWAAHTPWSVDGGGDYDNRFIAGLIEGGDLVLRIYDGNPSYEQIVTLPLGIGQGDVLTAAWSHDRASNTYYVHGELQSGGGLQTISAAVTVEITQRPTSIRFGSIDIGALANPSDVIMRRMVLKHGRAMPDGVEEQTLWFTTTDDYPLKAEYAVDDDGHTDNALVRFHPAFYENFVDPDEPNSGFRGGPGDFYEHLEWTPISRDYTLQKGFVRIPATKARFFKFEFSNLTPEPYEVFHPILRLVRLLPEALTTTSQRPASGDTDLSIHPGILTALGIGPTYKDFPMRSTVARDRNNGTSYPPNPRVQPTAALYATDPVLFSQLRQSQPLYGFQTWHHSPVIRRFDRASIHVYNIVRIAHTTKLSFFVGLREIKAYRLDFTANDDPDMYHERFFDTFNFEP